MEMVVAKGTAVAQLSRRSSKACRSIAKTCCIESVAVFDMPSMIWSLALWVMRARSRGGICPDMISPPSCKFLRDLGKS